MFGFFFKKKKKQLPPSPSDGALFKDGLDRGEEEKTEVISGADPPAEQTDAAHAAYVIRVKDLHAPDRTWNLPVTGAGVLFGRADCCQIQFHDTSVSRIQCKIVVQDAQLVVIQVGTSNQTKRNGTPVTGYARLSPGDVLEFGREGVSVDYIQKQEPPKEAAGMSSEYDEERTMSFF